ERAYDDFGARLDRGEHLPTDGYAAENPAEFFAVMSEGFFETPEAIRSVYPEVYRQLAAFYRQDPAGRIGAEAHRRPLATA
ncbi:MAG TPA: zinc-dependent peptidase, partial [Burkholderiales bacterium]|nr:zinc-dependent peptidase [Burkholderiales bacterium]